MDQILPVFWSYLVRLELLHHFQCRVPTQEQLTFRSFAEEMFIFLATFGEVPAIFQDFDAFIFINNSRHVEPLDRNRNVKRFSIVPYISTLLMPIRQPNPNRSAVCVLESRVMDKLHFLFIRYADQVSSKPKTSAYCCWPSKSPPITEPIHNLVAKAFKFFPRFWAFQS